MNDEDKKRPPKPKPPQPKPAPETPKPKPTKPTYLEEDDLPPETRTKET